MLSLLVKADSAHVCVTSCRLYTVCIFMTLCSQPVPLYE